MWTQNEAVFEGKYYHINGAINQPKGVQKPHIPMLIGGGGERVTLKLVAQYGDACNIGHLDNAGLEHKFAVLKQHCEDVGRDYNEIIKSTGFGAHVIGPRDDPKKATAVARGDISYEEYSRGKTVGTPEQIAEALQEKIDAGFDYFIMSFPRVAYNQDSMNRFAQEVIPLFA